MKNKPDFSIKSLPVIFQTNFHLPHQTGFYRGKVRDVYEIQHEFLVMVATDRISAFDVILPKQIPFKGMILNSIAAKFLHLTSHIAPNWFLHSPHPYVSIGKKCEPFKVEMVIRGYLTGHALREYQMGKRTLCGVALPDGMSPYQPFPEPIITPTTKADQGHDMDISKEDIIRQGIVSKEDYEIIEKYTRQLFAFGSEYASRRGLILSDTKYEFGKDKDGNIMLIDEIHTPDSSRYFYADDYKERVEQGLPPKQLSKEFVREWLMENGFNGREGQKIPEMTDEVVMSIMQRYIELYQVVTGEEFTPPPSQDILNEIENSIIHSINSILK